MQSTTELLERIKNNDITLTSLVLWNNLLGPEGGKAIAEALKDNTTLTSLDLGFNRLGPEGGKAIAEALKDNITLTSLGLEFNRLGPAEGKAMAEALKVNTTLTSLALRANHLGPEGGKAIAEALKVNTTLTSLDLRCNHLGPEGGKAIAEALKTNTTLTSIGLGFIRPGPEGGKAIAEALKVNTTLTSLDLKANLLGPEEGKAIAEALKVNTTLTSLDLRCNDLGPEGGKAMAEALKVNTTLTSLDLNDNNLGSEGGKAIAEALKVNTTLTYLDLGCNDLGPEGGKAMAEALKVNTTLTSLDLNDNNLGSEGGKAIAEALKVNTTLTSLVLWNNPLGPEGGKAIADALDRNRGLYRQLETAIVDNNIATINELISKGVSINQIGIENSKYQGYSPMMLACKYSNLETIKTLLPYWTNTENSCMSEQDKGKTALDFALKRDDENISSVIENYFVLQKELRKVIELGDTEKSLEKLTSIFTNEDKQEKENLVNLTKDFIVITDIDRVFRLNPLVIAAKSHNLQAIKFLLELPSIKGIFLQNEPLQHMMFYALFLANDIVPEKFSEVGNYLFDIGANPILIDMLLSDDYRKKCILPIEKSFQGQNNDEVSPNKNTCQLVKNLKKETITTMIEYLTDIQLIIDCYKQASTHEESLKVHITNLFDKNATFLITFIAFKLYGINIQPHYEEDCRYLIDFINVVYNLSAENKDVRKILQDIVAPELQGYDAEKTATYKLFSSNKEKNEYFLYLIKGSEEHKRITDYFKPSENILYISGQTGGENTNGNSSFNPEKPTITKLKIS